MTSASVAGDCGDCAPATEPTQPVYNRGMNRIVDSLVADLKAIGLRAGSAVLVHSSLRSLGLGRSGAAALWEALRRAVGSGGCVLVPTLSYETVTAANPVFDVRTTPSCVGSFPEWVRRRPEVTRSIHPTHSVAGVGFAASHLLCGHAADRTPAGPHSPFRRLRDAGGAILMVGCGLRPNTSIHGIEELSEPPYLFAGRTEFTCIGRDGERFSAMYRCHGHFPQYYDRVTELLGGEELHRGTLAEAESFLIDARALWEKAHAALRRNPTFFTEQRR